MDCIEVWEISIQNILVWSESLCNFEILECTDSIINFCLHMRSSQLINYLINKKAYHLLHCEIGTRKTQSKKKILNRVVAAACSIFLCDLYNGYRHTYTMYMIIYNYCRLFYWSEVRGWTYGRLYYNLEG